MTGDDSLFDYAKSGEMRSLIERLNAAADAYYNGKDETMSDFEWDALFDRLKKLEEETGKVLPESPTAKVSEDNVDGEKVPHEFPALSLAKTKSIRELSKWAEGRPVWISWKLDGLTLIATYDNGSLVQLATRGNGSLGTNITRLAGSIRGIPAKIGYRGHLVVRGEAVISYENFGVFSRSSSIEYANPRNLAAGSLSLKDAGELASRNIEWIPFTLVFCSEEIFSWGKRIDFLASLGFCTVKRELVEIPDAANLSRAIGNWSKLVTSGENPYPVDGLVVVYDDVKYSMSGSVTGHHATRAGIAFKWQDEAFDTELEKIEWSCAVSSITPVAVFKSVEIEGTTVKRASLCNISECERLGIGGRGSILSVIKANKIIPKVVAVKEKKESFEIPAKCPVCGGGTVVSVSDSGTKSLKCANGGCPAKSLAKYSRFVSKDGMDIDGLAYETIEKLVGLGWVRSFADIYRLKNHAAEMEKLEGMGRKSAQNLLMAIEKSRKTTPARLLYSLSIPLCGFDVVKRLLAGNTLESLVKMAREAEDPEIFSSIDGIGSVKSASFANWFKNEENHSSFSGLLDEIEILSGEKPKGNSLSGLVFAITGDVEIFKNRSDLKDYIETNGGKVSGSVSGKTSFLINNDKSSLSGKNKKAIELGIPVISEGEFAQRFGSNL